MSVEKKKKKKESSNIPAYNYPPRVSETMALAPKPEDLSPQRLIMKGET